MIHAEGATPEASLANPAVWINLGAVGVFLYYFITDKVFSKGAMEKVEKQAEKTEQNLERQVERLVSERDRALAERDEMIEVMTDFTQKAAIIFQHEAPQRRSSQRRNE